MPLEIYMIGLITADMGKSIMFYRRLGLDIPEGSENKTHVEVKMGSSLTFFLDSRPQRWDPQYAINSAPMRSQSTESYPFLLEFYLKEQAVLDAKYQELIGFGYTSLRAVYETSFGMIFALVADPDGNAILLSADSKS